MAQMSVGDMERWQARTAICLAHHHAEQQRSEAEQPRCRLRSDVHMPLVLATGPIATIHPPLAVPRIDV